MNSRRKFLQYAALIAASRALGIGPMEALRAHAQTLSSSYKALVCIYLLGGNDANNMIVPYDATGYARYAGVRGTLALPQSSLLQLAPSPLFALHGSMPELQTLYNNGNLAIVCNTGPLVKAMTRDAYLAGSASIPANLFSHYDQKTEWQNASLDVLTGTGWAGRIADTINSTYNQSATVPMLMSMNGLTSFINSSNSDQMSIIPQNITSSSCLESSSSICDSREALAKQILSISSSNTLVSVENTMTTKSYSTLSSLSSAISSVTAPSTAFPATSIGNQLKQILQIIQASSLLGVQRQIFFASFGDFDTHINQLSRQAVLLTQLSQAMNAFYSALSAIQAQNKVVTFTMSEFARTFQPNTAGGCDHGWGGHELVMGGAVQGGKMYGTYPTLVLGASDDCGTNGRWIPTTSVSQYAATLASWFGLSDSQIAAVFPYLSSFSTTNLGFV